MERDRDRPAGRRLYAGLLEMSYVDLADPAHLEFEYMRRIGDAIDLAWPHEQPVNSVHLGGAACVLARYIAATRPRSRAEVYENDAAVVAVAERELGLRRTRALRVRIGDARELLTRRAAESTDLVVGDAFCGTAVPAHLLTLEAALQVARTLRRGGVYALNMIDAAPLRLVRDQVATLAGAFEHVAIIGRPALLHRRSSGNVVLLAADRELPIDAIAHRAAAAPQPEEVLYGEELAAFAQRGRARRDRTGARRPA